MTNAQGRTRREGERYAAEKGIETFMMNLITNLLSAIEIYLRDDHILMDDEPRKDPQTTSSANGQAKS